MKKQQVLRNGFLRDERKIKNRLKHNLKKLKELDMKQVQDLGVGCYDIEYAELMIIYGCHMYFMAMKYKQKGLKDSSLGEKRKWKQW